MYLELTSNLRKSRLSLAFISAVAGRCGFATSERLVDVDSIDGQLNSVAERKPQIDFQAKATSKDILKVEYATFALPIKNYNDLRADTIVPRLLFLVLLPEGEADWAYQTEAELVLRCSGLWMSLHGLPEVDNETTVTVHVPRKNAITSDQLQALMKRANEGTLP